MRPPDFLHKDAETNLCEDYLAAGARCRLSTNSEQVLQAARETFLPLVSPVEAIAFSMRFWVDDTNPSQPPWPKPYVRGFRHLIFAGFDEVSSLVANLRTRQVLGRFSPAMAMDRSYFRAVIFPMLLTVVSATLGIAELHCACVVKNDSGLLLVGHSGAGKSTLSLALSQEGCGFVSDDRTFCSLENGDAYVWGLPTRVKLRGDTLRWFREFRTNVAEDGNAEVWLDPETLNRVRRVQCSRATALIFLERIEGWEFCLSPLSPIEALNRLTPDLMPELPDAVARRAETIEGIVERPCWRLRYGGPPQWVARQIVNQFGGSGNE